MKKDEKNFKDIAKDLVKDGLYGIGLIIGKAHNVIESGYKDGRATKKDKKEDKKA